MNPLSKVRRSAFAGSWYEANSNSTNNSTNMLMYFLEFRQEVVRIIGKIPLEIKQRDTNNHKA